MPNNTEVAEVEDKPEVLLAEANNTLSIAKEFHVTSQSMYELAAEELAEVKTGIKNLTERRLTRTRKLDEIKKLIMEDYAPAINKLEEARGFYEKGMLTYNAEQKKIRDAEQARLDAIAKAEREKLEAEARAIEQAATKLAQEAKGKAAKEAAAQAQIAAAEQAEALRQTSAVIVAATAEQSAPKAVGTSTRTTWKARVDSKMELIKFVAGHPEYQDLLVEDTSALNALARSQKVNMKVAGVVAFEDVGISSRRV